MIDGYTYIEIDRNDLFNDAFNAFMNKSPEELKELKKKLKIKYKGEDGIDAGGLLSPDYPLFKYSNENSYELDVNPNYNHLNHFRFFGRMIGLAIFHKQYFSISFTIFLCKKILDKQLESSDLKYIDSQMFDNLNKLRNNDGAENLGLTFSMDIKDSSGKHKTIELKPKGKTICVNDLNKNEYIE
ncbi:hypothetical protein PIROE2DRAFT_2988 [Piromyces sp. E2]|nr:hypothetical protein PIROE2DRAFT_2988 [Piromyces sp. E2]|eukprot:OUM69103.1 hypothetical protein PIROE2DRAFT_2988 [Piromyces sp. E2]